MTEPRSLQVRYRRYRPSVPAARTRAKALAKEWDLPQYTADFLEWVVTELVTNSVIHGQTMRGSRVLVAYYLADNLLRVEVRDAASGMPHTGSPGGGGYGLRIVAALADDWGVTPRVIGKSVWAEIAVSSKRGRHDW
ncbi:ATP-binding protein [Streptomyces sp. NPDC002276]